MRRYIGIKLIVAGSILGYANVSAYPITHVNAEEITISQSITELQSLLIEEFQLDQAFSPDIKEYKASVENEIKTMNVVVEKKEEAATITINGETINSGEKVSIPLATGNNEFNIMVTNGTEVSTYTIKVDRAKNDNNQLSNLSLSNGSFTFDPEKTDYQIEVKNEISKLTVKSETATDTSTVQVNGTSVKNRVGHEVALPVGSSTINVIVVAENGSKKTYTLTVTRQEIEEIKQTPTSNDEEKESATSTTSPATDVSSGNSRSDFTPETTASTTNGTKSTMNVESMSVTSGSSTKSTTSLGTSSGSSESEAMTTANLSSLTVSDGTWDQSFSKDAYTYHIALSNDVPSLTISADAEETDAEIFVEGKEITSSTTVTIENKAKTAISVVVKHDDDRKTYVLVFEKDIEEETTTDTAETTTDTETNATTVSTETEDAKRMKEATNTNQMNVRAESEAETTSFWQKILSFFGL